MPYSSESVEAELVLEHNGVRIYNTYKNDDIENGSRTHWFTTNEYGNGDDAEVFDVRDLSTYKNTSPPACCGEDDTPENHSAWQVWFEAEDGVIKAAIMAAIDKGEITAYDEE